MFNFVIYLSLRLIVDIGFIFGRFVTLFLIYINKNLSAMGYHRNPVVLKLM
jgi:hypothetical protein